MRYVHISHEQIVVADAGEHAATFRSAVDGHKLSNAIAIADARFGLLAFILQVLRSDAYRGIREEHVVVADPGGTFDVDVGFENGSGADFYVRPDDAIRTDFG